jgi:hypothetical protein
MSADAQSAIAKLLGITTAERELALSRASQLSHADAAAVFEELARRCREAETLSITDGPFPRVFEWVEQRAELLGEFVTFLKSLPDTGVPFSAAPRVASLASTPERKVLMSEILEQWKTRGGARLKKAAAGALDQLRT